MYNAGRLSRPNEVEYGSTRKPRSDRASSGVESRGPIRAREVDAACLCRITAFSRPLHDGRAAGSYSPADCVGARMFSEAGGIEPCPVAGSFALLCRFGTTHATHPGGLCAIA